ncbi:MAG: hypothetical protein ACTSPI_00255 [Candidatus Heimdallarchaeaceae archaeon]
MDFKIFGDAVKKQMDKMKKKDLFVADLEKDKLWDLYLKSFPEGTNPIYKERTEHDCNCCKNFIRDVGNLVTIENGKLTTIWDINIEGYYNIVAEALSNFLKKQKVTNSFSYRTSKVGSYETLQKLEDGSIKTWNHFEGTIPSAYINVSPEKLNEIRTTQQVFERGLKEISNEAVDIVLELIDQNSLYRGAEFKDGIKVFLKLKNEYQKTTNNLQRNRFCWSNYKSKGARIRNTVIGTLLQDISDGVDLDKAVRSFEGNVAPTNYKRPTALITKGMIENAVKQIKELGIEDSLHRRFATAKDLSVNNVLFAGRSISAVMKGGLQDLLMDEVKTDPKKYSKVEEIHINDFLKLIPSITGMEVLFEGKHTNNLVSLVAPKHLESPNILKWNNNFSWSYNGNLTDSIKERVKRAGGNVNAFLRLSLSWFNIDDLDIHVVEPNRNHIYYGNKHSLTSGHLDVDMNVTNFVKDAVENIVWTRKDKMKKGTYGVKINNFSKRETSDVGFAVEMEIGGQVNTYSYNKAVRSSGYVDVIDFKFDGEKVTDIKVGKDIQDKAQSQEAWNVNTEKFQKVSLLTKSPNHWDGNTVGNKHYFFVLDKCLNPEKTRGFYNEFLSGDLEKHRKVFEVLGNKTKCEESEDQLSGLGFSETKKDSVVCRVSGTFNRTLKINF